MSEHRFAWGDDVHVVSRGGEYASVCGLTEVPEGGWRYMVEFADGSSIEVDEADLTSA